jgi:hypothetical protein
MALGDARVAGVERELERLDARAVGTERGVEVVEERVRGIDENEPTEASLGLHAALTSER